MSWNSGVVAGGGSGLRARRTRPAPMPSARLAPTIMTARRIEPLLNHARRRINRRVAVAFRLANGARLFAGFFRELDALFRGIGWCRAAHPIDESKRIGRTGVAA